MGLFSKDTKVDCLDLINKMNQEMRAMNASLHLNNNLIDGRNKNEIASHYNNVVNYLTKFHKIKNRFPMLERLELESTKVNLWNGKIVDSFSWEFWLEDTMKWLYQEINK